MRELCPWYALTVKHQHEAAARSALEFKGFEALAPTYRARRRWSDRVKEIDLPLFAGYVFRRFAFNERIEVIDVPGVAKVVEFGGVPAEISESEMAAIRAVMASKLPVRPWPHLKPGDRVRVERGPLRGVEGTLLREERDRLQLVIGIEMLQRSLAVEVEADMVTPVRARWAAAKLDIEVHCRVLLTTPFETFSIGHTIVISRGLIDVLPDEGSLALTLASELAHIALGHATQTQFAFNNQTMLSDFDLMQRFRFERPAEEMQAASEKAAAMMRAAPYANLANAGLFLKALAARRAAMPRLLQASLGDQVADSAALARLASFAAAAPALEPEKLDQIAALPLGSRVKLNPWTNQLALVKTRPLALLSPREKMPFEVTPFVLYLTRTEAVSAKK